jgi:hypothetical protein
LYYYGARYYHSVFATFTQPDSLIPDPYNPQTLNRYAYTENNPLKYTDPSGHIAYAVDSFVALSIITLGAIAGLSVIDDPLYAPSPEPVIAPPPVLPSPWQSPDSCPGVTDGDGPVIGMPGDGIWLPFELPSTNELGEGPLQTGSDIKLGKDKAIITNPDLLDEGMGDLHDTIPGKVDRYGNLYSNKKVHSTWRTPGGNSKVVQESDGILDYKIETEKSNSEDDKET